MTEKDAGAQPPAEPGVELGWVSGPDSPAGPPKFVRPLRRRRSLVAAGLAVVLFAGAGIAIAMTPDDRQTPATMLSTAVKHTIAAPAGSQSTGTSQVSSTMPTPLPSPTPTPTPSPTPSQAPTTAAKTARPTPSPSPSKTAPPTTSPATYIGPVYGYDWLCLDDKNASTTNYNPVQIWTCNGGNNQKWTFVRSSSTIQTLGMCLDVHNASTTSGTLVDLFQCNNTGAQVWTSGPNDSLVNPQSGLCLDDPGDSTTPGTQMQIWTCLGDANQRWQLQTG